MVGCRKNTPAVAASFLVAFLLSGCANPNQHALELGKPPLDEGETTTSLRVVQSRSYATVDTTEVLAAGMATLQDLGFTIEEASGDFGVITGSKDRDAKESGQVAGQVALSILLALLGSYHNPTYDESQKIQATLMVHGVDDASSEVRIFFDRQITNNHGLLWKADLIKDPQIYQEFFTLLSQSTFFEENSL